MAEEIDRIRIVVEPDSSGFQKDLETDLAKVKVDVNVPVDVDTTAAKVKIEKFKKDTQEPLEVIVTAETTPAGVEYKKFVKTVEGDKVEIPLDADDTKARAAVEKFTRITEAKKTAINIDADTRRAREAVERIAIQVARPRFMPIVAKVSGGSLKAFESTAKASIGRVASFAATSLGSIAFGTAAVGAAALFVTLRKGTEEALTLSQVTGQLNSAFAATGVAAAKATKATLARAAAIESVTGIDEIAIAQAEKTLIVLGKQTPQSVGKATRALVNLAAATANGQDPAKKLASLQVALSKALANPAKASGVLARSGVVLSKSQQDLIKDLVASGKTAKAQGIILDAIAKKGKGAAAVYGTTLPGQLSRAKDVFNDFARTLSQGVLRKALPAFLGQAKQIGAVLGQLGPQIGAALGRGVEKAISGFLKLSAAIKANLPEIKRIATGIVQVVIGAGLVINELSKAAGALFTDVINLFTKGEGKSKSFGETINRVGKGLKKFAEFLRENQKVAKIIVAVFAALGAAVIVAPIVAAATAIGTAIAAIGATAAAIIAGILALGAAFVVAYNKSKQFRELIANLKPVLDATMKFIAASFQFLIAESAKFAKRIISSLGMIVKGFNLIFKGGIKNVIRGVLLIIGGFVKLVFTILSRLPRLALAAIIKLGPTLLKFFGSLWLKIINLTVSFLFKVVSFFARLPFRIISAAAGLVPELLSLARRAMSSFANAISTFAGRVVVFMRRLPSRISSALGSLTRLLYSKGKDVIQGLFDGLKYVWNKVEDWLSGLGQRIKDLKGPIEVDRTLLYDEGKAIMTGFQRGLEDKWRPIESFLDDRGSILKGVLGLADFRKVYKQLGQVLSGDLSANIAIKTIDDASNWGLHPSSGLADTMAQERILHRLFGITGTTFKAGHSKYVAGRPGVISDHWYGRAVDFGDAAPGNDHANLDRVAQILQRLLNKVFKQIIWHGGRYSSGPPGGHRDHMHLGWLPRRHGGRTLAGQHYEVNEGGRRELFVPDTSGFVMSHAKLQRLLSLQERVKKIESASSAPHITVDGKGGRHTTNNFKTEVKLEHNVPDASSLAAILNTRLDSAMRNFALAGGAA